MARMFLLVLFVSWLGLLASSSFASLLLASLLLSFLVYRLYTYNCLLFCFVTSRLLGNKSIGAAFLRPCFFGQSQEAETRSDLVCPVLTSVSTRFSVSVFLCFASDFGASESAISKVQKLSSSGADLACSTLWLNQCFSLQAPEAPRRILS